MMPPLTTLTMDDYLGPRFGVMARPEFDAWLVAEGIARFACVEITFGEGICTLVCLARIENERGQKCRVLDPHTGRAKRAEPFLFTPTMEPPASVMAYLATRE